MFDDFFGKFFGKSGNSRETAKKRLKFALVYDKLEISGDLLSDLQRDIVEVISRYFEIDTSAIKLDIKRSDDLSALVLNTPILSAKRR